MRKTRKQYFSDPFSLLNLPTHISRVMPALTINMQTMINGTVPLTFTPIILKVLCLPENPQSLADWILLNSYYQLQLDLDGYPQPWDLARAVPTLSGPQGYFSITFWAEGGSLILSWFSLILSFPFPQSFSFMPITEEVTSSPWQPIQLPMVHSPRRYPSIIFLSLCLLIEVSHRLKNKIE